ncbi:Coenzyme F420 hydrogenase/dehydrogenase, beta subunit C-terminal domain [Clostridium sp. YIM B02555]|uniref:Coenzyme F420 hydrogenase/dehydrogenase, beta subunit C-terminal domain n=1 Tax=Clostridium sp. YIM B02555 TaxID=2911968 RepID=UPI001EEE81A7|nr:Coenzyme F420 hydrogenase/dehydrogenase, beta subunit C-terminal domain [Clostridium sp. YIM B02555]
MIDIVKKSDCSGCYSCANICPKECINIEVDDEGFGYPVINNGECTKCNLCEKACPVINDPKAQKIEIIAYACRNKNEDIRKSSSSGGVFTLLCEEVIKKGGVVFGAAFDENYEVKHIGAETIEECEKLRGSKYVQSKIGNTYKQAKDFLNNGRLVLFSGTQCQIKGLNLFLNKSYDNLITSEIICHGVPSPKIFKLYKENLKNKYNSNIKDIRFRDKALGWNKFSYVTEFENNKIYSKTLHEDIYMKGFLHDLYLRPSCYECKAKNFTSNSDISLADYWGVEKKHSEFNDDKGISLVLVNTEKGKEIFEKISCGMEVIKSDIGYAISNNPCIVRPVKYNKKREKFFKEAEGKNLEHSIMKYTKTTLGKRIKGKIQSSLGKLRER